MKTVLKFITLVAVLCAAGHLAALPTVTTCEIQGTGAQYQVRSKDCSAGAQAAACDKYKDNAKLAPAEVVGCKAFNTKADLKEGLRLARLSRDDPQPPGAALAAAGPAQIPVVVTCMGGKRPFITLAGDCSPAAQQEGCDIYKDVPHLGPSKAAGCRTFTRQSDLIIFMKKAAKDGSFPGFGGGAVTCKTRGTGTVYGGQAASCQLPAQQLICQTAKGIADPIACKEFPTDLQVKEELEKLPGKLSGIECQTKVGGIGYRFVVPDCSDAVKVGTCKPKMSNVKSCQAFPNKQAAKEWTSIFINEAWVSCRLNAVPTVVYDIPGRDCTEATKKAVCGVAATPVGCRKEEIEKLRQEMIKKS